MADKQVYDEASTVSAKNGEVAVKGPDHVDIIVTPEAAAETGERLIEVAAEATGQRRLSGLPHQPK